MAELKQGTTVDSIQAFNLPIGTIILYNGAGWTDNSTLPGFYACTPENEYLGLNSFVDRFAMGTTNGSARTTGSNNSKTLGNNLAQHAHKINHLHSTKTVTSNATTDGVKAWHNHNFLYLNSYEYDRHTGTFSVPQDTAPTDPLGPRTGDNTHSHNVTATTPSFVGTGNNDVENSKIRLTDGTIVTQVAFDGRPAFYSAIYIRRCV